MSRGEREGTALPHRCVTQVRHAVGVGGSAGKLPKGCPELMRGGRNVAAMSPNLEFFEGLL